MSGMMKESERLSHRRDIKHANPYEKEVSFSAKWDMSLMLQKKTEDLQNRTRDYK